MKKYYLYGAGINCAAVIKFLGSSSIVAVIDSDEKKHGQTVEGIRIISLEEYINRNAREQIIITGFYASEAIAEALRTHGIKNFYISPYMQMGFYENGRDIVNKLKLEQYPEIACCTENPISILIEEELRLVRKDIVVKYIDRDKLESIDNNTPLIVTNKEDNMWWQELKNAGELNNILDINAVYEEKYGFKNEKILKFRDIHKGKRCFVIGNGPSLKYEDLECLRKHGEVCFGVNRIYLAYEHTLWRPDYYVAVDYFIVQSDRVNISSMPGIRFIRHLYKMEGLWKEQDIYEFRGLVYPPGAPCLSQDMYSGIYTGNTVVYDAIQIALYMGFQEIYLLGVDMTRGGRAQDEGTHFYKSPDTNENLGWGNISEEKMCLGYAAKEMEKEGKRLRNATRGGELNNVPRVDFDSLF